MFDERSALQMLFMKLDEARERRYQQHVAEMAEIDKKLTMLLDDLRRMDEEKRVHDLEMKEQQIRAQVEAKNRLATMKQNIVPSAINSNLISKRPEPVPTQPDPVVEPIPKPIPKPAEPIPVPDPPKPETMGRPRIEGNKKIFPDNTVTYQVYYHCPKCKERNKRYIPQTAIDTFCRGCGNSMRTRPATSKGFPHQDTFGNYFVAGDFVRVEDRPIVPPNPVDDVLAKYEAERKAEQEAAAATEDTPMAAALKKAVKS